MAAHPLIGLQQDASPNRGKVTRSVSLVSLFLFGAARCRVRRSPDRLDALVWALTDLMLGAEPRIRTL